MSKQSWVPEIIIVNVFLALWAHNKDFLDVEKLPDRNVDFYWILIVFFVIGVFMDRENREFAIERMRLYKDDK